MRAPEIRPLLHPCLRQTLLLEPGSAIGGLLKERRTPVTVAINWDGTNLSGTVNPGSEAVTITKGSFAPDTGMVTMDASANASGGKMIHYTVEGKLAEGAITGTWMDGDKKGDFKITKS